MAVKSGYIGGKFRPFVEDQIGVRNKLISTEDRDSKIINYLNGKSSWIKLTSSVNIGGGGYLEKKFGKGNLLAKDHILFGGTLSHNRDTDTFSLRGGISSSTTPSAYQIGGTKEAGFRPMPGITGITVKSKNRFGSLREATVKFQCWNKNQLEIMELLYMRPGYSLLLEWGHSLFFTGKKDADVGSLDYVTGNRVIPINFFQDGLTQRNIYSLIEDKQITYGCNYDGMYGLIKNFSYQALENNGYECSVDIVSIGEVVESLKVNSALPPIKDSLYEGAPSLEATNSLPSDTPILSPIPEQTNTPKISPPLSPNYVANTLGDSSKSYLHQILSKIYEVGSAHEGAYSSNTLKSFFELDDYRYYAIDDDSKDKGEWFALNEVEKDILTTIRSINFNADNSVNKGNFVYITLGTLLAILESKCLLYDEKSQDPVVNINFAPYNTTAFSHWAQLSVDPYVCLMDSIAAIRSYKKLNSSFTSINKLYESNFNPRGDGNKIYEYTMYPMKIPVNIEFIKKILDKVANDKGEIYLYPLLTELLKEIARATGSINEYEVIYDAISNSVRIIDTKIDPGLGTLGRTTIEIATLGSFVKNYSMVSRIFPSMATMIAISAQANGQALGIDSTALSTLNYGLTDRIIRSKQGLETSEVTDKSDSNDEQKSIRISLYRQIKNIVSKTINSSDAENNKDILRDYLALMTSKDPKTKGKAFIPMDLSLTLDGLSGIRIGETFLINSDKLPVTYLDDRGNPKVAFIVREISHEVRNNQWNTIIGGFTIINSSNPVGL